MVEPFEAITTLYSLPASTGIDATPFFSFFYALFFGMMLSDVAYGIIIAVGTYVIRKKYNLEGEEMPKMKTHSGAKKRFRSTGTGKLKFKKPGQRHLLTGMKSKKGRSLRKSGIVDSTDMTRMKKFMPYSA